MSHQPSTSVKVPTAATTYTPATQDVDLRSQINVMLLREGHAAKIQEHFLHSLDAHTSNWPSAIQSHALALLRSGEVSTFPALVRRVLEDVRRDTATASASASSSENNTTTDGANGTTTNGVNNKAATNGAGDNGAASLAIPSVVVDSVLKNVRESLSSICEIDEDAGATGG